MKFISSLVLIAAMTIFFIWWKNSNQNQVETEKNKLATENVKLKDQLVEMKNSPAWLLQTAKQSYNKEDYRAAKEKLLLLVYKHQDSKEYPEAKRLLNKIDEKLNPQFIDASLSRRNEEVGYKNPIENTNTNNVLKMRSNFDVDANATFYQDQSSPRYKNQNGIYLYFEKEENENAKNLRLRIQLLNSRPFPIDNYQFNIDNKLYSFIPAKVDQDGDKATNWEWSDERLNKELYGLIVKIIYSNNTIINFNSSNNVEKRAITGEQKTAFKNVLAAYQELGGSLDFK